MAPDIRRGRALLLLLVACCCVVVVADDDGKKEQRPPVVGAGNTTLSVEEGPKIRNETDVPPGVKMGEPLKLNPGAVLRAFYVFVGLSAIVVVYIIVRTVRLRRRKMTVRKYGILANRDDVEMAPLDREDDDEDTTLFDLAGQTRQ